MPILSDLDAAMMQPARSVPAVRRLGGGLIRMNDAGRPLRAVGRDAVVYELRTPSGRILVLRCFLRPDAHRDRALAQRTLMQTIDRLCREGQVEPLALLADVWLATATAMEEAEFVHGDLAPDNLIVRPDGSIALVDLDTATWPAFADTTVPA
ncbi:MAG: hypothetical protein K0S78_6313, partial [Thermomicrobiales bacterium]|nr:hypothetical protein [Thermomicrobiales bacterium]